MEMEDLRIACIGAGSSGAGHLIMLEQYAPGSVVAFCDIDRTQFDSIVGAYLGGDTAREAGDFKTDAAGLRPDFKDLPYYTDPEEMFVREEINTVVPPINFVRVGRQLFTACLKFASSFP